MEDEGERKFTTADIEAIVSELEKRALERFQKNVGKGLIIFCSKWVIRAIFGLAMYGAGSSGILKKLGL